MTINITENEALVLNEIARHEMNSINGDIPENSAEVSTFCWAEDFTGGLLTVPQVKGVLSSLVQKEFIVISQIDDIEGTPTNGVNFTDAGFDAWFAVWDGVESHGL